MTKPTKRPVCHVIAGPNGAGKSTFALRYLPAIGKCEHFVNADLIAAGLSPLDPGAAAFQAGRLVIEQIKHFASRQTPFGFESTLSGRQHVQTLRSLKAQGYRVVIHYLWIPSAALAIRRIRNRVELGGHHVPANDVRRRFGRSLRNLFALYAPLADELTVFDNSTSPPAVVFSQENSSRVIHMERLYRRLAHQGGSA